MLFSLALNSLHLHSRHQLQHFDLEVQSLLVQAGLRGVVPYEDVKQYQHQQNQHQHHLQSSTAQKTDGVVEDENGDEFVHAARVAFNLADANGDGEITTQEMKMALQYWASCVSTTIHTELALDDVSSSLDGDQPLFGRSFYTFSDFAQVCLSLISDL